MSEVLEKEEQPKEAQATDRRREVVKAAATTGVCAGVGGASASSVGGVGLAALGTAAGLSATAVVGVGILGGGIIGLALYGAYRLFKK